MKAGLHAAFFCFVSYLYVQDITFVCNIDLVIVFSFSLLVHKHRLNSSTLDLLFHHVIMYVLENSGKHFYLLTQVWLMLGKGFDNQS